MPSDIVHVRLAGLSDVGLVREHNEDSFLVVDLDRRVSDLADLRSYELKEHGTLLLVCDGMGGAAAGEVASNMAVDGMRRALLQLTGEPLPQPEAAPVPSPEEGAPAALPEPAAPDQKEKTDLHDLARLLRDAVYGVNLEIFEAACADLEKAGMGTTLTALWLRKSRVVVAQVGDSRAYMWRQGKLTQITHDQSLVNQLLDSGQITPEQAKLFEHSNVILQALGVQEDVEVLISTEKICQGDRVLVCSDGLVGVVSDEEIEEVLGLSENLDDTAQTLIDMARAAGGPDNITVLLAQVDGESLPQPSEAEEVLYRPLPLDPPLRRLRGPESDDSISQRVGFTSESADVSPPLSLAAVLSMAWVVGLAVAGMVVGVLLYPHNHPSSFSSKGALCYFIADSPELEILVDGQSVGKTAIAGTEVRIAPGDYRISLRDDSGRLPGGRSDEQLLHVSPGERCALKLRPIRHLEHRAAPEVIPVQADSNPEPSHTTLEGSDLAPQRSEATTE